MHVVELLSICLALATAAIPNDEHEVKNDFEDDQYFDYKDKRGFRVLADDIYDYNRAEVRYESVKCNEVMDEIYGEKSVSGCSNLVDVYVNMSESSHYSYMPSKVKVKRCGGMCSSRQACMPTGKKFVKRAVERTMLSNVVKDCTYAFVEEHTGCTCGCVTKEHHCKGEQTYNETSCQCECVDIENKKGACLHKGYTWHGSSCECRCPDGDQSCPPGYRWDTDYCKCVKKRKSSYKGLSSWRKYF